MIELLLTFGVGVVVGTTVALLGGALYAYHLMGYWGR